MPPKIPEISELKRYKRRTRKNLKRKKLDKKYDPNLGIGKRQKISSQIFEKIIARRKCHFHEYYKSKNFISNPVEGEILTVPSDFSLLTNYSETVAFLRTIIGTLYHFCGTTLDISFKECKKTDIAALFVLKLIYIEFVSYSTRILKSNSSLASFLNSVKFTSSDTERVRNQLFVFRLSTETTNYKEDYIPKYFTDIIVGSRQRKHYLENIKGQTATKIVHFINRCIRRHSAILTAQGVNQFEGLTTEILNNAEDHTTFDNWYIAANLFETNQNTQLDDFVGEVNITIFNFGYSIYEGFELTKKANAAFYDQMKDLYNLVLKKNPAGKTDFNFSDFVTLYALSEGFSSLKYKDESRGNGTIRFLNSFINLGDFEDEKRGFIPKLTIISGKTMLICDKVHKPFKNESGVFYLSLNKENDMLKLPSKENLITLPEVFPGTLINATIYLNKNHLKSKIQ